MERESCKKAPEFSSEAFKKGGIMYYFKNLLYDKDF